MGISHRVGSDICYWLMTDTGNIVPKTLVKHATIDYNLKPEIESRVDDFNNNLTERIEISRKIQMWMVSLISFW